MKTIFFLAVVFILNMTTSLANGVLVVDATNKKCLTLLESSIDVQTESQVAVTTSTQKFINNFPDSVKPSLAFPMPAGASVIGIKWKTNGIWNDAHITAKPQDTTLPGTGSSVNIDLQTYLGNSPLCFNFGEVLTPEQTITVTITYVELLPYELGNVSYFYKNDYSLIQQQSLNLQSFHFVLKSSRQIDSLSLDILTLTDYQNDGTNAELSYQASTTPATTNYSVHYQLRSDQLGLFGFSTYKDSIPDNLGRGFLLFVAEPDASQNTATIPKVFTLVIDRSGSMGETSKYGTKIEQAKNAAKFIVNNLNEGDYFNIIDYDNIISSFMTEHVPFDSVNKNLALKYINGLSARNTTDIGKALQTALGQFPDNDSIHANIILFFTDGLPTEGVTDIPTLLTIISSANKNKNVIIFPFGIGDNVDKSFLSKIADQNNGIADFLLDYELQSKIQKFYLLVRNPVLLNSSVTFVPPIVTQIHPEKLPNLYKGQQMLVTGRYSEPVDTLMITLNGSAFGKNLSYTYPLHLANSDMPEVSFLTKVWAKMKIEDLMIRYYLFPASSPEAKAIKDSVTDLSIKYQIMTVFTSFKSDNNGGQQDTSGNGGGGQQDTSGNGGGGQGSAVYETKPWIDMISPVSAFPNPFSDYTIIRMENLDSYNEDFEIEIYSLDSKLINSITVTSQQLLDGFKISGKDFKSRALSPGMYICLIKSRTKIFSLRLIKI